MTAFPSSRPVFCCVAFLFFAASPCVSETGLPTFDPSDFAKSSTISGIGNRYFPLVPGQQWRLEKSGNNKTSGQIDRSELTVMQDGPVILGVPTMTILDREFEAGRLKEETRDFFAQDQLGNVWYFGEAVMNYVYDASGNLIETNTDSAWLAGVEGAQPGFIMPADPKVGTAYFQEYSKSKQALDMGEIYSAGQSLSINGREFTDVLVVLETTPLDPESREFKYYAPGVGLIRIEEDLDANLQNPVAVFELGV